MCGIAGFCNMTIDYHKNGGQWQALLERLNRIQKHRGPDEEGTWLDSHCGLAHTRLSVLDPENGHQPMTRCEAGRSFTIVYNGEIYNMPTLRHELEREGITFATTSDTEVILAGCMYHGWDYVKMLNGIFAFAVWDGQRLRLFRDRVGVKPLFYSRQQGTLVFASEIKGLLAYPGLNPEVDREGLCEVLGLGPAKTYGKGVFRQIKELLPGHYLEYDLDGLRQCCYWQLESHPHEDSEQETLEKTTWLVTDAIRAQMLSDVPVGTFLSGGVDSSLVTAICVRECQRTGKQLDTFSFDFQGNEANFRANSFQPTQDRAYVEMMVEQLQTQHHYLECSSSDLYRYLYEAVEARDLPCMADVESSLLYFCRQTVRFNKVVLTGECADEIFGGYPWFHDPECFSTQRFPWSRDLTPRTMLLKEEIRSWLKLEEYVQETYRQTIRETPVLPEEKTTERRRREIAYLNLKWFMQTLLDRMDRCSMRSGLEARVPFADHRIIEYMWNVPWEQKCHGGMVKGLLRAVGEGILPGEVLYRKKSPYPKTYDPGYEKQLKQRIRELMTDTQAPIRQLLDEKRLEAYLAQPVDYGKPFYGQLMAGPQLLAYLIQVNYWLEHYQISLR